MRKKQAQCFRLGELAMIEGKVHRCTAPSTTGTVGFTHTSEMGTITRYIPGGKLLEVHCNYDSAIKEAINEVGASK